MVDITTSQILDPISAILQWLINSIAQALPKLIAAILILLIGWIIATVIGKILEQLLKQVKLDRWLAKHGIQKAIFNISVEDTAVLAMKWYIAFLFIEEAVLRMGLAALGNFFHGIIVAVPSILVGATTVILTLVIASWLKEQILKTKVEIAEFAGSVVYGFTAYIGIVLALPKFGFTQTDILMEAFRLFVGGLAAGTAIAIGIGFGLAIKEGPAKAMVKNLIKETKRR